MRRQKLDRRTRERASRVHSVDLAAVLDVTAHTDVRLGVTRPWARSRVIGDLIVLPLLSFDVKKQRGPLILLALTAELLLTPAIGTQRSLLIPGILIDL